MPVQEIDASSGQVVNPDQSSESDDHALFPEYDLSALLAEEPPNYPGYSPEESTATDTRAPSSTSETSSGESADVVLRVQRESPYIEVHGEPFRLKREKGRVTLTHDHWSLRGSGSELMDAVDDLHECARRLAPAYVHRTPDSMTKEAARMRDYIANVMSYAVRQT